MLNSTWKLIQMVPERNEGSMVGEWINGNVVWLGFSGLCSYVCCFIVFVPIVKD